MGPSPFPSLPAGPRGLFLTLHSPNICLHPAMVHYPMKSRLTHPCSENLSGPGKSAWPASILPIQPRVTVELQHWDILCCCPIVPPPLPPYPRGLPGHASQNILPWCSKHDFSSLASPIPLLPDTHATLHISSSPLPLSFPLAFAYPI